jgi:hypothetical protein
VDEEYENSRHGDDASYMVYIELGPTRAPPSDTGRIVGMFSERTTTYLYNKTGRPCHPIQSSRLLLSRTCADAYHVKANAGCTCRWS